MTHAARPFCYRCHRSRATCYCAKVRPFESDPEIVVLMHPRETEKRIGTGRMIRNCISNSRLFVADGPGIDAHGEIAALVADPARHCVVLFPGPSAWNLDEGESELSLRHRRDSRGKRWTVFVVDGTWSQARKMLRTSAILRGLPPISFNVRRPSGYLIREQPADYCLSSLEAVHSLLDSFGKAQVSSAGGAVAGRPHDCLLELFSDMVQTQLRFELERK